MFADELEELAQAVYSTVQNAHIAERFGEIVREEGWDNPED